VQNLARVGTPVECDECNRIFEITVYCYCDMNICKKCYLQNLKHEHLNILHKLARLQLKTIADQNIRSISSKQHGPIFSDKLINNALDGN
jgi:hypothetical protein